MSEKKIVARLTAVGVTGNILLVAFKLYAGIAGHSGAMVSDAVHSLSDVFATFIAFIGVKLAQKGPDRDHPYGHDRLECLASTAVSYTHLDVYKRQALYRRRIQPLKAQRARRCRLRLPRNGR